MRKEHYVFKDREIYHESLIKAIKISNVIKMKSPLNISELEHNALLWVELCPLSQNILKS